MCLTGGHKGDTIQSLTSFNQYLLIVDEILYTVLANRENTKAWTLTSTSLQSNLTGMK